MNIENSNLFFVLCVACFCLLGCDDEETESASDAAPMEMADMGPTGGMDMPMDPDQGMEPEPPDAGERPLNGCTLGMAEDRTGDDMINIPWGDNHGAVRCNRIRVGATVVWATGDFSDHNLLGGPRGERDADSPISMGRPDDELRTQTVVFETAGVFPYYCLGHPGDHMGVIYVGE